MHSAIQSHRERTYSPFGQRLGDRGACLPAVGRDRWEARPTTFIEPRAALSSWIQSSTFDVCKYESFVNDEQLLTADSLSIASAKTREVIALTSEIFGGPVTVQESYDPEHPNHKWIVVTAEATASRSAILKLESEWARRISSSSPHSDGFRLRIKRKR